MTMDRTTISIAGIDDGEPLGQVEAAEIAAVLTAAYLNHPDPARRARIARICRVLNGQREEGSTLRGDEDPTMEQVGRMVMERQEQVDRGKVVGTIQGRRLEGLENPSWDE